MNIVVDWMWDGVTGRPAEERLEYINTDGRAARGTHPRTLETR